MSKPKTLRSMLKSPKGFASYLLKLKEEKPGVGFAAGQSRHSCPIAQYLRDEYGEEVSIGVGPTNASVYGSLPSGKSQEFYFGGRWNGKPAKGAWPKEFIRGIDAKHKVGDGETITPEQALAVLCDVKKSRNLKLPEEVCCGKE